MNPHELSRRLARYADALRRLAPYGGPAEKDLACGAAALAEGLILRLADRSNRKRPAAIPPHIRGLLADLWARESLDLLGVLADASADLPVIVAAPATSQSYPLPASPWSVLVVDPAGDVAAAELPPVASGVVTQELTPDQRQEIASSLRRLADTLVA